MRRRTSAARKQGPHLLEFGVRWPPETFVARRLERLVTAGYRVTVASLAVSSDARTLPRGVGHVRLREGEWRLPLHFRGALALLRVFCRSPRRALAVVRAAAAPTAAGRSVGRREAAGRLAMYARLVALRPDVVHFEWTTTAVHFSSLVDALACPAVISCHGGDVQIFPHSPAGRRLATGFRTVLRRAAAVHTVSDAVTAQATRFGADPRKARLIRAAVDPGFFRPPERDRRPAGRFSVVAVGTLRWVKGFEYALLAVAELARDGIPVTLDVLGGDPDWGEPSERDRLLATSAALGLDARVRLHGCVLAEDVRDRLQAADVYLQSSLSEGHPTAVVEAMACGVPVVATDCGGTREALTDGVEGFLVAPRDWRGIAEGLRRLWHDPELRIRMGRQGRVRVESEFRIDRQTDDFLELYGEVIAACS
jgi:colanic acid/amylovoran biosynthesis glycosyltransferase